MCELYGTSSNCARTALHQDCSSLDWTRDMNGPVSGDTWNSETGTLLERCSFGKLHRLAQRNYGVLGGGSKGTVGLSAVTPHTPPDPGWRHSFAHRVNRAGAIAVRNDARIRHSEAKSVLAFLYIPWVDA